MPTSNYSNMSDLKEKFNAIYHAYNRKEFIHPDPLEYIYNYDKAEDKEIVGLIASSLAYGRVAQILKSVKRILTSMGDSPSAFIMNGNIETFNRAFTSFKHRFTTRNEIVFLINGIKKTLDEYGSLKNCFVSGYSESDVNYLKASIFFVEKITSYFNKSSSSLLPSPEKGSACKRLMLYLKWMIRHDDVDPGCWNVSDEQTAFDVGHLSKPDIHRYQLPTSKLIIPLDTHMYKIGKMTGATQRRSADMKTALEMTEFFSEINHEDPVKYDFALTRFGIRAELKIEDII